MSPGLKKLSYGQQSQIIGPQSQALILILPLYGLVVHVDEL